MGRVPPDVALVERENFLGSLPLHHLPAARSWKGFDFAELSPYWQLMKQEVRCGRATRAQTQGAIKKGKRRMVLRTCGNKSYN